MKKLRKLLLIILFSLFAIVGFSQDGPPPPTGGSSGPGTGGDGNELGGNAPVGSGLFILLSLGAMYGGNKVYEINKEKKQKD